MSHTDQPRSGGARRRILLCTLAVLVAVVVGIGVLMRRHAIAAPLRATTPALTVTVTTPHSGVWPVTIAAPGSVAAWQEASIGTQIGGYQLIDVAVNVGDQVRSGQVLARFDPALLRADEAQLQATYEQAEANRQRIESLRGSGAISDQDVLQYVTQARTAQAALAAKRLQLRYTDVVAPDSGAISARSATLGAVVPVGQELFRLVRQNRLEWRGELTATQLAHVAPGQQVALDLPDGGHASARVREIAPVLDTQSRVGIVFADLVPGSSARAGMYANGQITLAQTDALMVPAESVVIRDGHSYVLRTRDTRPITRVELDPVSVGRRVGSEVEITSGLRTSDRLVVQGAGFLNEGDTVSVVSAAGPEAAR